MKYFPPKITIIASFIVVLCMWTLLSSQVSSRVEGVDFPLWDMVPTFLLGWIGGLGFISLYMFIDVKFFSKVEPKKYTIRMDKFFLKDLERIRDRVGYPDIESVFIESLLLLDKITKNSTNATILLDDEVLTIGVKKEDGDSSNMFKVSKNRDNRNSRNNKRGI